MSIYKYTSFENLKHILNGSIRLTQPSAFNDPFELLPEIYLKENIENKQIGLDIASKPRESNIARLPDDFENEQCNDIPARYLIKSISESVGILCLSKNPNSLLMWSHYADQYKGVVVEFDEEHEFFSDMHCINYEDNRPKINFYKLLEEDNILLSEMCFKPKVWEYEEEVRIIRCLKNCKNVGKDQDGKYDIYTMNIPLEAIKSITMGERIPIENTRFIFGKLYDTNIEIKWALISNLGYGFRYEIIKHDKPFSEMSPVISPRSAHIFKDLPGDLGEMSRWMIEHHPMSEIVNLTV